MLDRTISPVSHSIPAQKLIQPERLRFGNSEVFHFKNTNLPVVKIEFLLSLNSVNEVKKGSNFFTVKMLQEGTKEYTSLDISDIFSQKGAFIEITPGIKRSTVAIYCLTKHVKELLPLLFDLITSSSFPEEQLSKIKKQTINNLKINKAKNAYVAAKSFNEHLFGIDHFYGRRLTESEIEHIDRDMLIAQHGQFLKTPNIDTYIVGNIYESDLKNIEAFVANFSKNSLSRTSLPINESSQFKIIKDVPSSVQSTIKIGKLTINKQDTNYPGLYLLNEILGGYFGSRLMTNLREEKGLTYGIYSRLRSHLECAIFEISADVIKKDRDLAKNEIFKEIQELSTSLIQDQEIEKVKHYIAGNLLNSTNTIFDHSDRFKTLLYQNLPLNFYDTLIERINVTSAIDLQLLTQKHLSVSTMNSVTVG